MNKGTGVKEYETRVVKRYEEDKGWIRELGYEQRNWGGGGP